MTLSQTQEQHLRSLRALSSTLAAADERVQALRHERVEAIHRALEAGLSQQAIGNALGISQPAVRACLKRAGAK